MDSPGQWSEEGWSIQPQEVRGELTNHFGGMCKVPSWCTSLELWWHQLLSDSGLHTSSWQFVIHPRPTPKEQLIAAQPP